jgi:hypothetical protein
MPILARRIVLGCYLKLPEDASASRGDLPNLISASTR